MVSPNGRLVFADDAGDASGEQRRKDPAEQDLSPKEPAEKPGRGNPAAWSRPPFARNPRRTQGIWVGLPVICLAEVDKRK